MKYRAYAKVNLFLDIKNKRIDGYHNLDMVMQLIDLHDEINIEIIDSGIVIDSNDVYLPKNEKNTAYKACDIFLKRSRIKSGIKVYINKMIPKEAGLGGGSSDAACVMVALNKLFETNYSLDELEEMSLEIGSDVPFFIRGNTQYVSGRGEILSVIENTLNMNLVLVKPKDGVSTKEAYSLYEYKESNKDVNSMINAINEGDIIKVGNELYNKFEDLIFPIKESIKSVKEDIDKTNPLGCLLSGSGSTVFGIYKDQKEAKIAYIELKAKYNTVFLCKT